MGGPNTRQILAQKQSLVLVCFAFLVLWSRAADAQSPNPFLLQWGHDGVNNLSPPTSAVSTTIGPFTPGTPLSITVTTLNNQPATEYFSKVRLIWSGRQEDFKASDTMEYGLECLPFKGTFGNSQVVWDFAAATTAPFTQSGLEIAFFFQMNGVIGNVQASNLILTVELTDNLFAVTQKSYVVQIAQPASPSGSAPTPTPTQTPTPSLTPTPNLTPNPTLTPTPTTTPTPTPTSKSTATPTPSPSSTAASPTPTSTPTFNVGPQIGVPTPTPTQTRGPTNTPTPTPSKTPQSTTPASTDATSAATCPYQPAASAGNPCFSADGHTSWFCADPSPQCAQNAVSKCLPTKGYPFHNAAGQTC